MKRLSTFVAATALIVAATCSVWAEGTGAQGYFQIYNDTADNIVVGFYTNDGSGWSANWLGEEIQPGRNAQARFHADTGLCEQTIRVGWLAAGGGEVLDDPTDIDICDASNVYLGDNEITYD